MLFRSFGALGLASGAIFWLYLKMAKRMDALTDNFQKQLKEQMEDCNRREAEVRDRFMDVVKKYDDERLQWVTRLDSIDKEMQDTEALIKEGLSDMRNHYARISAVIGKEVKPKALGKSKATSQSKDGRQAQRPCHAVSHPALQENGRQIRR